MALLVAVVHAASACGVDTGVEPPRRLAQLRVIASQGDVTLRVRIADSREERVHGLMGVRDLADDEGMVFLYDEPTGGGFWMKNTLVPLSVAFWDRERRIVGFLDMEPCPADPCPTYAPEKEYVGAVEVNRGFFDAHGIGIGDIVELAGHAGG
jgi:uncharacterized protein